MHYRHEHCVEALYAAEDRDVAAELLALERRALSTRDIDAHRLRVTLDLPKDLVREFLRSLEYREHKVRDPAKAKKRKTRQQTNRKPCNTAWMRP